MHHELVVHDEHVVHDELQVHDGTTNFSLQTCSSWVSALMQETSNFFLAYMA